MIQDTFTPVVRDKLAACGIEAISVTYPGDGVENVANAVTEARRTGAEIILCTGGMSVDPDDNTREASRPAGPGSSPTAPRCCPAPCSCWATLTTAPR